METHTKNVLMCPHKSLSDCCSREWSGFFFIKSNATYIIEQGNVLFNNWVFTNANFFVCAQFEYFEMNVSITNTALHGDGSTNFTSKKRNSLKDHEWYSLCCRSYLPTGSRPSNRHNFLFWFSKRNLPNQICTWWSFAAQFFVCLFVAVTLLRRWRKRYFSSVCVNKLRRIYNRFVWGVAWIAQLDIGIGCRC